MTETQKRRLGEILIEDGCLSPENLQAALQYQKKEGGMIGQILVRLGHVNEDNLIAAIGKQLQIPYIPLMHYSINTEATKAMGEEFCRRHTLLIFDQDEKRIYLAMGDPLNDAAIEEIRKKMNLKPQVFISTPTEIFSMMDLVFSAAKMKKAG